MTELPSTARVVVIGGGVVGVSCLYHLARAGWSDCVLLEKDELTSGSTWHAAGNVPTFSSSWSLMNLQRYSAALYRGLADEVGYPLNYHVTGSLRLAHTRDRMLEFERVRSMGRHQGMELEVLGAGELKAYYPFLQTHDLQGALLDPCDGDIDPSQLTQALAKGARDHGALITRACPVTAVRREGGTWRISSAKGEIRCTYVVNAAGYRAHEVGRMFGRVVPQVVMSHQYLLFETIPELAAWSASSGRKLPLLRDVDSSYYLRQEKLGMNLGPYERDCRAHWASAADPMPEDFSFQLFPDDIARLEWHLEDAVRRVPILGTAGLSKVINGPIPYTPDGNPLIGPMPGVPDAYEACVFTFGIAQAGGAGRVLAEWVMHGRPDWDMWSCDPRRFTGFTNPAYCLAKGIETYAHEYAIQFPRRNWTSGRDLKRSPLHERMRSLGAQFTPYNGWERGSWYARAGDDISEGATQTFAREGPWQGAVREECLAVRDRAGILDLPGFSRFRVEGAGAAAWLARITTGSIPAPGRMGLAYFADALGRVVTEMSVMSLAPDAFILITAAVAQWHDREWLERQLPMAGSITITDLTEEYSCQILTGPAARAILTPCCAADLAAPWLTHQETHIAARPCRLVRVSFAGELGWEIHSAIRDTQAIFEEVWEQGTPYGLRAFGMFALDSLRLEKGYRAWKVDLSTDYSVLECGLARFIDWGKPAFLGREALAAEKARGSARRFVTLTVDAQQFDAPYMASLWHGGQIAGEVTSGGFGHRTGASIALAMVRADLAVAGTVIEVEIFGKRYPGTVAPHAALWDPQNIRMKS